MILIASQFQISDHDDDDDNDDDNNSNNNNNNNNNMNLLSLKYILKIAATANIFPAVHITNCCNY